jgi:hypothetical protein
MIHTHTMTQLKTVQEPMKLLSATNLTNVAIASLTDDVPSTSMPVTANSAVVIPTSTLNYIKIVPMFSAATAGQVIRVTGYTKTDNNAFFVPQLLYYGTVSAVNTTQTVINSQNMFSVVTHAKTEGDAKVYTATSAQSTASLLVDTIGCHFIKIDFAATSAAGLCNAFVGAI